MKRPRSGVQHGARAAVIVASLAVIGARAWQAFAQGEYDKKIVPIISVGQGLHIGAAEVVGPRGKVSECKAVAQLEVDFKKLSGTRIKALVPISTENVVGNLKRVDQVAVSMYGDVDPRKLF